MLYDLYLSHPSIQTDTRKLQKGDIFFALKGPNFNGNSFAKAALDAGAAYAVIDEEQYQIDDRTILVHDALAALQELAFHHRNSFDIPFLAITGSNGKTTTKELIHAVLSTKFRTYTTEGNLNNHIGVPLTILKIRKDAQLAVIEMGANHRGEIASYCDYARPTHGLITNVGKAHLEGFGGEEGVRLGKGELFDHLKLTSGKVFIMNDYDYLQDMSRGLDGRFSYGTEEGDVIGNISNSEPFLQVAFSNGFSGEIKTQLVGEYNLPNILAAVAVGKYFGVEEENIRMAIENYKPSNSRSQLITQGSNKIILDAYNANPSSMKAAIQNFAKGEGESKVLFLGHMAEMGEHSKKEHEELIEEISRHRWKEVVLVGDEFSKVDHPYRHYKSAEEAGKSLGASIQNSYILVKGSRSMQMEKVIPFLDQQ